MSGSIPVKVGVSPPTKHDNELVVGQAEAVAITEKEEHGVHALVSGAYNVWLSVSIREESEEQPNGPWMTLLVESGDGAAKRE